MASSSAHALAVLAALRGGAGGIEQELLAEKASGLGRAGRDVEAALARLQACGTGADRAILVRAAADAVWTLLVQREACGLTDPNVVLADYAVPREVWLRVGAR